MNDRELLERAAKAAGMAILVPPWPSEPAGYFWCDHGAKGAGLYFSKDSGKTWNPLTDDGDAFRLAVALGLDVTHWGGSVNVNRAGKDWVHAVQHWGPNGDHLAATRRAIVRAAASLAE